MALQLIYVDEFGNTHPNAYYKIMNVNVKYKASVVETNTSSADEGVIVVEVYHDYNARITGYRPLKVLQVPVDEFTTKDLRTLNTLRTAMYTYMKTLPEFVGAGDI
jgi:hypothetical protein